MYMSPLNRIEKRCAKQKLVQSLKTVPSEVEA